METSTSTGNMSRSGSTIALCASCDRCRSRKTKCDGQRPCSNCAAKYMKKHKLTSLDGVDPDEFDCIYSPAKRRGPVPRSASSRKASGVSLMDGTLGLPEQSMSNAEWPIQQQHQQVQQALQQQGLANMSSSQQQQQQQLSSFGNVMNGGPQAAAPGGGVGGMQGGDTGGVGGNAVTLQRQLELLQQLQQQQQQQQQQQLPQQPTMDHHVRDHPGADDQRMVQRIKREEQPQQAPGIPRTITMHTHLLEQSDPEGIRLVSYYKLSIDELFRLPPTLTDEEYCARLNMPGMTPSMIPGSHLAALSAARFAEVALGALVHNEVSLGLELCNAVVHCLRESVQEPVQKSILFEVSKAYFLLGVFRACRGDMPRYFKYRRVCMTYLSKLDDDDDAMILLSAISYLDSWAYMIYNANEKIIPSADDAIPPVGAGMSQPFSNQVEMKFKVKTDPVSIATSPANQNWIQGAPQVYLNNEAPLHARTLDALACAVRSCCDHANSRFASMSKEAGDDSTLFIPEDTIVTPTATAVLSHENELCSRNMVLSAYTLMQHQESSSNNNQKNEGQHLVISAMDAFLENSDEDGNGGFTDSQIQSLLSVCNTVVENPFLLHHAGPTYHMVTNAAVLLCHLLNGMYAMKAKGQFGPMESAMFEEVLDTFISIRKLLTMHRRKMPVQLRCHGIPRPNFECNTEEGQPFIDMGETLMCACRGCQGFVLMACSPCVAAERARAANDRVAVESAQESAAAELGELDRELDIMGEEFNLDDDALLNAISSLINS